MAALTLSLKANTVADRDYTPWQSSSFGGGGFAQNIVIAPSNPDVIYATVDVGGVYRSDDGGLNWRMIHGNLPSAEGIYSVRGLTVSPNNADDILIAVGNQWAPRQGIFRTTDSGKSWDKVLGAQFFGNEVFRSAGNVFARNTDGEIFAGTGGDGVFISSDDGATWKALGLEDHFITDIDFDSQGNGWICSVPWESHDKDSYHGSFFFSSDNGQTWTQLAEESPQEIVVSSNGTLVGIFNSAIIKHSDDLGKTWLDFSQGLPIDLEASKNHTSESRFQAIASGPDLLLLGSSRGSIYQRKTSDSMWTIVPREAVVEFVDRRPWWGRIEPGKWQHFGACMGSITIAPNNPDHWWFTDWYGIYETGDAGRIWTLRIDGIETTVIHDVIADPTDPAVIHVGMADNAYARSLDGGATFDTNKPASNMKMLASSPALPSRIYATGDNEAEWRASRLWVSTDRGDTWHKSPMLGLPSSAEHSINSIQVHPENPYEVILAVSGSYHEGGGVYRSIDGGKSFVSMNEGLGQFDKLFLERIWALGPELAMTTSGRIALASQQQDVTYYYDGTIWIQTQSNGEGKPQGIIAAGESFLLSRAEGGLWESNDDRLKWDRILNDTVNTLTSDATNPLNIAVSTNTNIQISSDGGNTWAAYPLPPHGLVSTLTFAGERLVAGTRGGGLFWMPLTPDAETPIVAGKASSGMLPVVESSLVNQPEIHDGAFDMTDTVNRFWTEPWIGEGNAMVERITLNEDGPGGALKLYSVDGPTNATTSLVFPAVENHFQLKFRWKVEGLPKAKAQVALVSFESGSQIAWIPLTLSTGPTSGWATFDAKVKLASSATLGKIVVLLNGEGSVFLDDLETHLTPLIFGTPIAIMPTN
ncbi:WD40/YVTN/BNR-like repeat-containing protein [Rubellicoccus peritrichatus]|uniref:Sortilin N-terminal domain-containing protein n=1 Tax=Rubellicoccus peritrichatus TaxID=3080537 RepID=A0AAQ3L8R2_9BACT|nr:hypothetical protein [Puniceicoccus sp. CR14]WOO39370.1 hypothetical protein RZN69_12165 [Puniceicoccus sp. CR14]